MAEDAGTNRISPISAACCGVTLAACITLSRHKINVTNHAGVVRQNGKLKASAAHVSIELLSTLARNASTSLRAISLVA
jgi:hypothetical protein